MLRHEQLLLHRVLDGVLEHLQELGSLAPSFKRTFHSKPLKYVWRQAAALCFLVLRRWHSIYFVVQNVEQGQAFRVIFHSKVHC